jgi:hypothetical protein
MACNRDIFTFSYKSVITVFFVDKNLIHLFEFSIIQTIFVTNLFL